MARPDKVFCFTGHRPDKIGDWHEHAPVVVEVRNWLHKHIRRIVDTYDTVTFISGGALGVDTWAFHEVHNIRFAGLRPEERHRVNNVLILPCIEHYIKWPENKQRIAMHMINTQATHVFYSSSDKYKGAWQMQKRNEAMVDKSDGVIAVWNESEGGTKNCIDYAIKKNVPILGYNPDKKKQFRIV